MNALTTLDTAWLLVIALTGVIGLALLVGGLRSLFKGKLLRGPLKAAFGVAFGALAVALAGIGMNLYTYHRLDYEAPVASVEFQQVGARHYQALIHLPDGSDRAFGVYGDEWQLDARVLKWKGIGSLLGLDPRYRLERFSGRYRAAAEEQHATRSVYGLAGKEEGIDVWKLSQEYNHYIPLVDTIYGSATYMPMADGATYDVLITEDGLIARATNDVAKRAVEGW